MRLHKFQYIEYLTLDIKETVAGRTGSGHRSVVGWPSWRLAGGRRVTR